MSGAQPADPAPAGTKPAPPTSEAELDRLADAVDMDGLDESDADDDDLAEFASLATELLQEEGAAPGATNGTAPTTNGATARARAEAALGSLMSRARTSGFGGLRFGSATAAPATTGPARDAFHVLGVRDAARWREVVTRDAAKPAHNRPISRSYRCARGAVRKLDEKTASALAADAMRAAAKDCRIPADTMPELVELAERLGPAFLPEIERALASRVKGDPDFYGAKFPKAAGRFCA